jgi:predicted MPP superfamily phosphohydrolase
VEHIIKKSKEHNGPSSVVITGDIASASKNSTYIFMDDYRDKLLEYGIKLYFVLGNHDYYDSQIATERSKYANGVLAENWLGSAGVIPLTTETYLIGHDGWYDGGSSPQPESKNQKLSEPGSTKIGSDSRSGAPLNVKLRSSRPKKKRK